MSDAWRVLPLFMLLATATATAGDLSTLPTTDSGFRQKIETFIQPGGNTEEALRLLEANRFECREFENKNPVIHCVRMDEPGNSAARFYQVMIESSGARIKSVTPSVGRIRR